MKYQTQRETKTHSQFHTHQRKTADQQINIAFKTHIHFGTNYVLEALGGCYYEGGAFAKAPCLVMQFVRCEWM